MMLGNFGMTQDSLPCLGNSAESEQETIVGPMCQGEWKWDTALKLHLPLEKAGFFHPIVWSPPRGCKSWNRERSGLWEYFLNQGLDSWSPIKYNLPKREDIFCIRSAGVFGRDWEDHLQGWVEGSSCHSFFVHISSFLRSLSDRQSQSKSKKLQTSWINGGFVPEVQLYSFLLIRMSPLSDLITLSHSL